MWKAAGARCPLKVASIDPSNFSCRWPKTTRLWTHLWIGSCKATVHCPYRKIVTTHNSKLSWQNMANMLPSIGRYIHSELPQDILLIIESTNSMPKNCLAESNCAISNTVGHFHCMAHASGDMEMICLPNRKELSRWKTTGEHSYSTHFHIQAWQLNEKYYAAAL